jgi:nucleoside-diphosphate-sugar epimerase
MGVACRSRYLVTGGAAFIGSHIAEALLRRGEVVGIPDNFSTGLRANGAALEGAESVVARRGLGYEPSVTFLDGLQSTFARAKDGVDAVVAEGVLRWKLLLSFLFLSL